jgi:hypothetical protein
MGALNEKCLILCDNKKVNDQQTIFENNIEALDISVLTSRIEHNTENFLDIEDTLSPITTQGNVIKDTIIRMNSQYIINRPISFMNDTSMVSFVMPTDRLPAYVRGYLYRKKFKTIRLELEALVSEKYNIFMGLLKAQKNIVTIESKVGQFDRTGYLKYYKPNDKQYEVMHDMRKIYECKILIGESSYYSGFVDINYKRNGYGVLIKNNGKKYEGNWKNGTFTGWGRFIDIEGNLYEGYFEKAALNGKGEIHTLREYSYTGDFIKGQKHGVGSEETPEYSYIGDFKNDKKEGLGKLIYTSLNDVYEGEFRHNGINGFGKYTWSNNDTYEGYFKEGKMHGEGRYYWPDGSEYIGEYVGGIKEGSGRFKWANGKVFDGPFHKGKPHGVGKLIVANNMYDSEFNDGKMVYYNKKDDSCDSTQTYTPVRFSYRREYSNTSK